MKPTLNRREFVQAGLYGSIVLLVPLAPAGCGGGLPPEGLPGREEPAAGQGDGRFFTARQYQTVKALTGVIIPEDEDPGAVAARVADFIDFLLGAFTVDPPRIYAAGPFSGRHGGENGFRVYLPLSRVKEIAWRNQIEGSRGIPEREFNGPVRGLQEIYTEGLDALDEISQKRFGTDFIDLDPADQEAVVRAADPDFIQQVFENTVEGMYAAPEYGGNADAVGWKYIRFEGDRQPVGYTREQVEEPDPESAVEPLGPQEQEAAAATLRMLFPTGRGTFFRQSSGGI